MKKTKNLKHYGFTLSEVLIAVAIVGVIAGLILSVVVTKYQENVLAHMYTRDIQAIQQAIDSLAVTENKTSFYDTVMYSNTKPSSYEDNAGRFLKKYLRVARYCGQNNSKCFAKTYYEYKNNNKKIYAPVFEGACALLKNGASICITPKIGNDTINGIIDLNGPKGPNVSGRDLRIFSIDTTQTRTARAIETEEVYSVDYLVETKEEECNSCDCDPSRPGCSTPPENSNACSTDKNSPECCITSDRIAQISTPTDACCNVAGVASYARSCQTVNISLSCSQVFWRDYHCYFNVSGYNANSYGFYYPLGVGVKCESYGKKVDCNSSYGGLFARHRNGEKVVINNNRPPCYLLKNDKEVKLLGTTKAECMNINTSYTPYLHSQR